MEKWKAYILLKDLPDTDAGTRVIWDESANAFYYEKTKSWVSPHSKNYLTAGQVSQSPEWFIPDKPITYKIIDAYEKYLRLLKEETDGLIGLSAAHGWKSDPEKVSEGARLRGEIADLKKQLAESC